MQPDRSNWRDQAAYDYLDDLAAPELGWECLRRNPEYQHDYAELAGGPPERADLRDQIGRRWGLCFPDPARSDRDCCRDILASGDRYQRRGLRGRPRGALWRN
ncbi:transcriptional regulator domain-containing protein [Roseibium aggregatum]|uniref:transcriptional regulator domain-containing protein n=1 Tax=Roseibium aggregatum TaxID=187304 RepID=UPI003AF36650